MVGGVGRSQSLPDFESLQREPSSDCDFGQFFGQNFIQNSDNFLVVGSFCKTVVT